MQILRPVNTGGGMKMYSLRHLQRQVDPLKRDIKSVLAILKLRNPAMEFCDEFDEAASSEKPRDLRGLCMMFPPRVGRVAPGLGKSKELLRYFLGCISSRTGPDPREVVFTLIPWARKGPTSAPASGSAPPPPERNYTPAPSPPPGSCQTPPQVSPCWHLPG